jgi:hypothetical protein
MEMIGLNERDDHLSDEELSRVNGAGIGSFLSQLATDVKNILKNGQTGGYGPGPDHWGQGPANAGMGSGDV